MTTKKLFNNQRDLNKSSLLRRGMTLLELTVVLVVLLTLIGVSAFSISGYKDWQLASEAGTKLRAVYSAQRTYLAEHPTAVVADLTDDEIADMKGYLSDGSDTWPTIETLDGLTKTINVKVSPPVITGGYDPSGSTTDGQWDVGE